jgi:hypothetical protein
MLNKIRTSPEILASKVDHVAARNTISQVLQVLTLKAGTGELAGNKKFPGVVGCFNHPISHCVLGILQASKNVY